MSSEETINPIAVRQNLFAVLVGFVRILKAEYVYLLYLSFLYFFPKSLYCIAYPTRHNFLNAKRPFPDEFQPDTLLPLAFTFFTFVFSHVGFIHYTLGLWSITSTVHSGRPVKLISALFHSAFVSFFPLIGLVILSIPNQVSLFNLVYSGQDLFKVIRGVEKSNMDLFDVIVLLCSVQIHLELSLAPSIVVIESQGLVESMRRSSSLLKGKGNKLLALMQLLIFGTCSLVLGLFSAWILEMQLSLKGDLSSGGWWRMITVDYVVQIVMGSVIFMLVLLFSTVSNTVLYRYCIKAERNGGREHAE